MNESCKGSTPKEVVILTCFAANEPRAEYIKDFFQESGKSAVIISTDFIHRGKYYREDSPEGYCVVKTRPYKTNLSITRLYSHYVFAKAAMEQAAKYEPELLYVMIPANSLAHFAVKYKKQNNCKLVLDIIDLWPESLPIPIKKNIWPLSIWGGLRDKNLTSANEIITECTLYQEKLRLKELNVPVHTVYWPQEDYGDKPYVDSHKDIIRFLYLGSINNIIDIEGIVDVLNCIKQQKKVELQIVGDGEKREYFLELLKKKEISVKFHGSIYDHQQLYQIASLCHMGINMMKPSVQIGLTMKSVTYFEMGLPIINNLKGDTWDFIDRYQAGINIEGSKINKTFPLPDKQQLLSMGSQSRKMFEELFSKTAFYQQMLMAIDCLQEDF